MVDDDFYMRFEGEFRGSRSEIKRRVSAYLPLIAPLKKYYPKSVAVDLGCGRGEWIELLVENDWRVLGVDSNKKMIEQCQSLGLPVLQADANKYLRTLKKNSVSVVSGFHIAEHIPFESLLELVKEAYRTLLPGGILILETPNPENNIVRASSFYLDPTHRNPLPPSLMQFVAKDCGFYRSVILRLNGPKMPKRTEPVSRFVMWALTANPDYGLVAQKSPSPQMGIFEALDKSSSKPVDGLTILNNTIVRFENDLDAKKSELYQKTNELQALTTSSEAERQELRAAVNVKELELQEIVNVLNAKKVELQELHSVINNKENEAHKLQAALNTKANEVHKLQAALNIKENEVHKLQAALNAKEAEAQGFQTALIAREAELPRLQAALNAKEVERQGLLVVLDSVYASHSWRFTLPFRKMTDLIRWSSRSLLKIIRVIEKGTRAILIKLILRLMKEVFDHPSIKVLVLKLLNYNQNLKNRLKSLALAAGIIQIPPDAAFYNTLKSAEGPHNLSSRAQQIYMDLINAIVQNIGGR
jgi:SAM-dependent methyltransferase